MPEQSFSNHHRFFPPFHFFVLPVLLINLGVQLFRLFKYRLDTPFFVLIGILSVLLAGALLLGFVTARMATLKVQDRLIRLEERLRYARLLPADLQPRIGEFTVGQLVSLRFASDEELPALARKVLDEKVADRKTIKRLIKNWKPDYLRA